MDIKGFRAGFQGSRSNRYKITGTSPTGTITDNAFELYAKSVSFPGSAIGMIPVSYQGRVVKFTGERQFAEWSIQVYDSAGPGLRELFEAWIEQCDGANTHIQKYDNAAASWTVKFDDTGTDTTSGGFQKTMTLYNCWPIDISAIDLNYEAADSFAEFTLTFAYDYHVES
jgi:hypothetical protein